MPRREQFTLHADGLLKNEEIYNIFNTDKLLNRPVRIAISNTSGTSGIAHWINSYFNLRGDAAVTKNDKLVEIIYNWVNEQYNEGRVTMITDGELEELTLSTMKKLDGENSGESSDENTETENKN